MFNNTILKTLLITFVTLLTSLPAYSLEVGDTIAPEIEAKLNLPEGKVAVVDFFASWCQSCAKEIPQLHKFIATQNQDNVQIIGVDVDEDLAEGLKFQQQLAISFNVLNDTKQEVIQHFNPIGMPALYYIKDNKIIGKHIGAIDQIDQKIASDLQQLGVKL